MSIRGNSRLIDEIKSFFLLSVSFSDSLHVVYEGVLKTLLSLLKIYNSKMYANLELLCERLKFPRQVDSYFSTKIDDEMKGKDYKFFLESYGWKCLLLAGFPRRIVDLFRTLAGIVRELEDKENKGLKVKRIIELHNLTLNWTDKVAEIFGSSSITSKFHRLEHMIAEYFDWKVLDTQHFPL